MGDGWTITWDATPCRAGEDEYCWDFGQEILNFADSEGKKADDRARSHVVRVGGALSSCAER